MCDTRFDVLAIGNAIVDILAHEDETFLTYNGLNKGTMSIVNDSAFKGIYTQIEPVNICSGGSAANSIFGIVSLGARGAFIGKISDDDLGNKFRQDMRSNGVYFQTPASKDGPGTATCVVLVTPDAERTMQTYLGACVELGPEDINVDDVGAAKITFLEGYLWDPPAAKEAFLKAAHLAHHAGRKVSLSLSDPFCVERHREDFVELVENHIDILFANEDEILSLYKMNTFEEALKAIQGRCEIVALTRGALGCVILQGKDVEVLGSATADRVVDTTGAGDAFAAGFLAGYTQGNDVTVAARMGNIAAAEVISHMGARPSLDLKSLVAERLTAG